jgi:hypothetical protein
MFRNPLVAVMHLVIYAGFIIINIEVLEIVLDGILGTHRLFFPALGFAYSFVINFFELLAAGVILVCVAFLYRRNVKKLRRFQSRDLDGWPRSDANYILGAEILLMILFLTMNTSDRALQLRGSPHYADTGNFIFSGWLAPLFNGVNDKTLQVIERSSWWLHITGIFVFLNYLPYSKHLHIILAFPNAYYARLAPPGKMDNMPNVQNEVAYMMQPELGTNRRARNRPRSNSGRKMCLTLAGKTCWMPIAVQNAGAAVPPVPPLKPARPSALARS